MTQEGQYPCRHTQGWVSTPYALGGAPVPGLVRGDGASHGFVMRCYAGKSASCPGSVPPRLGGMAIKTSRLPSATTQANTAKTMR